MISRKDSNLRVVSLVGLSVFVAMACQPRRIESPDTELSGIGGNRGRNAKAGVG